MVSLVLVGSGKLGSGVGLEKLGSHVIWIDLDSCLVPGEPNHVNANEGLVNIFTVTPSNFVLLLFFVTDSVQVMGGSFG